MTVKGSKMFRPLLAATIEEVEKLVFPFLASPKLDGIRSIILDRKAVSRNLKTIRNLHIQSKLRGLPEGMDGELIVGSSQGDLVFNRTTSGVMSEGGEPDCTFNVFDMALSPFFFIHRFQQLLELLAVVPSPFVKLVPHTLVESREALYEFERQCLELGY